MLREQLEEMSTRLAKVTNINPEADEPRSIASPPETTSTVVTGASTAPQSPSHGKQRPTQIGMDERKQWYIGAIAHFTRLERL